MLGLQHELQLFYLYFAHSLLKLMTAAAA